MVIVQMPASARPGSSSKQSVVVGNPDAINEDWPSASVANATSRWVAAINPAHLNQQIIRHVAWRVAGAVTVSVILSVILVATLKRFVLKPVHGLRDGLDEVQKGRWGQALPHESIEELDNLVTHFNQMSHTLQHMESERRLKLERAARLQRKLHAEVLNIPGLAFAHWHAPADTVGGDSFDAIHLPDDSWVMCIADVTGHGVAAAMGASILKFMLRSTLEKCGHITETVQEVDRRFSEAALEEDFASLVLLRWSPASRSLSCINAGHEDVLLLRPNGRVEAIPSTGTLIGLGLESHWEAVELTLEEGDLLVLVTDGVNEAMDKHGRQLGRQAIRERLSAYTPRDVGDALETVRELLQSHIGDSKLKDDVTIICLKSLPRTLENQYHSPDT